MLRYVQTLKLCRNSSVGTPTNDTEDMSSVSLKESVSGMQLRKSCSRCHINAWNCVLSYTGTTPDAKSFRRDCEDFRIARSHTSAVMIQLGDVFMIEVAHLLRWWYFVTQASILVKVNFGADFLRRPPSSHISEIFPVYVLEEFQSAAHHILFYVLGLIS